MPRPEPLDRSAPAAAILLAAAALAGGGCSAVNPSLSSEPRLAVEGLTLRSIGPDAAEGDVHVRLWVDRGEPIQLDDYQYAFRVDGRTIFSGRWAALAAAPPDGPIVRSLPVVIPLGLLPEEVRRLGAAEPAEPPAAEASAVGAAQPPDASAREIPFNWSVSGSVGWADAARLSKILLDLGFANPRTDFSGRGGQMRLPAPASPG